MLALPVRSITITALRRRIAAHVSCRPDSDTAAWSGPVTSTPRSASGQQTETCRPVAGSTPRHPPSEVTTPPAASMAAV